MTLRVTVLMPVYNGAEYLRPTMESILNQSFSDFEFLIIDDGSTDSTVAIIRSFSDSRIRLLKNPTRLKLSGALNRGLDEARGEYVARMDGDDIAMPDRLAKQVALLDSSPDIGICGGWIKRFGMGRNEINRFPETAAQVRAYSLFDCPFAHPTVMIRKRFFDRYKLRYDGAFYPTEDYELWSRVLDLFPCVNIPEVLLHYRVHDSSMTCSDWGEMDTKAAAVSGRQLKVLLRYQPAEEEVLLHRNVGRGESYPSSDIEELQKGERWLQNLIQANKVTKQYDENALLEIVALIWYRFCFHAGRLGFRTLRCYLASSLRKNDRKSIQRGGILFASILKQKVQNIKK